MSRSNGNGLTGLAAAALALLASAGFGAAQDGGAAALCGDGVRDDTAAIQALLDARTACVYLPPPKVCYRISKSLRIHSGQELRLDRFTRVELAPKSDCAMVRNADFEGGNARVAVTGGIWDMMNARQSPNPIQVRGPHWPKAKTWDNSAFSDDYFFGAAMRFRRVKGLSLRSLTIRNPTNFSVQLLTVSDFTVDDITFDFTTWNPIPLNMDGIHVDGGSHRGRITNLRGTTFDDLVAINADECWNTGPISDIVIDGVQADWCHSAVRLLSAGSAVERITIRNVFGRFYTYAVGFTHYFSELPRGRFEDVVVESVFTGKAFAPEGIGRESRVDYPIIWFEGAVDAGSVTIRNLTRAEREIPVATVRVDPQAKVRHLTLRDCRQENHLAVPVKFLEVQGNVEKLTSENNDVQEEPAARR